MIKAVADTGSVLVLPPALKGQRQLCGGLKPQPSFKELRVVLETGWETLRIAWRRAC